MKNNKLILTNYIIIGICSLLAMLLMNFISIAAMATSFISNTFNEQTTGLELAEIVVINGIYTIIVYIALTIVNYFLAKKQKNKSILIYTIGLIITLIILILKNIFTLM